MHVKSAFSMTNGQIDLIEAFGEDAWTILDFHLDPFTLVPSAPVVQERSLALAVFFVEGGQEAELNENLKTVTDAEREGITLYEFEQRVPHVIEDAVRVGLSRTGMIAVGKAPGNGEDLIRIEFYQAINEVVDVHDVDFFSSSQVEAVLHFLLAVEAVAGEDQNVRL